MFEDLRERLAFPSDFLWGVATTAVAVEGALGAAERGESIWDRFSMVSPRFGPGETPRFGADHCNRLEDDVELLERLGVRAYRFSLAWPRIAPSGTGKPSAEGIAFYDRLLDRLLAAGIEPFAVLYAGDLPQAFEARGGWPLRDTAHYFADFAALSAGRFADRARRWITVNDPWRQAFGGYYEGTEAPGRQDFADAWAALHHLLLGHGEALAALREIGGPSLRCGIGMGLSPVYAAHPASDERAWRLFDAYVNRSVLDPVLRGAYPEDIAEACGACMPEIKPGDLGRIAAPIDFVGVNYYSCRRVAARRGLRPLPVKEIAPRGERTLTGREIHAAGLRETLLRPHEDYGVAEIYVTENGAAFADPSPAAGSCADTARIEFLDAHVRELHAAVAAGAPVKGYFVYSLLDGFEGPHAYAAPYGLVAVDREANFKRRPKESFRHYASLIEANALL